MVFSLGGKWDNSWSGASDFGLGNWSTIGKSSGSKSSMFDPISLGIYGLGQLGSAFLTGNTNRQIAAQQRKDNQQQAFYGMLGTTASLADARAERERLTASNTLAQFGNSLFNDPMAFGMQRRAQEEDIQRITPMKFALQRQEESLDTEKKLFPSFRERDQDVAKQGRIAGLYAAALEDMVKWGQFNLPTA
jgi:hypothetical protein